LSPLGPATPEDRAALSRLSASPGLCATCVHLQVVASSRSVFVRCGLSDQEEAFPRYPPLPVLRCAGYSRYDGPNGA
jgi:hypothetical protein